MADRIPIEAVQVRVKATAIGAYVLNFVEQDTVSLVARITTVKENDHERT